VATKAVILDVGGVLARDIWEYLYDDLAASHGLDRDALHEAVPLVDEEPLDLVFIEGFVGQTVIGIHDGELAASRDESLENVPVAIS